jgi:hypothetical protein
LSSTLLAVELALSLSGSLLTMEWSPSLG